MLKQPKKPIIGETSNYSAFFKNTSEHLGNSCKYFGSAVVGGVTAFIATPYILLALDNVLEYNRPLVTMLLFILIFSAVTRGIYNNCFSSDSNQSSEPERPSLSHR